MKRDTEILKNSKTEFDCVVIGGGIQGAGIARELSLQGLKTLLVDRGDFSGGTSSRSTKLIHGGLRYLEQGRIRLVQESLAERARLLQMTPQLVRPLAFLLPVYRNDARPFWQIRLGLTLYDWLTGSKNIQKHENWSCNRISKEFPGIKTKSLVGGSLYWDAQMNDSRLCLEVLKAADQLGASVFNYMRATGFVKSKGKISAVNLKDLKTGESFQLRGKVFINATGYWADKLRQTADAGVKKIIRWSKGIHVVASSRLCPAIAGRVALIRPTSDKRVFFVLPWLNNTILIGTTDTEFEGKPTDCYATAADVEYLLKEFKQNFPDTPLKRSDFLITYSGLRSLLDKSGVNSSELSREYKIEESTSGLISTLGGKYSTFRSLASKVADKVFALAGKEPRYEDTSLLSLEGLACESETALRSKIDLERKSHSYGLSDEVREYLWQSYGHLTLEIFKLLDYDPSLKEGITPAGYPLKAEIVYAIKDEMALTLTDFYRRRSQLFYTPNGGLDTLETVAEVYQDYLHWSDEEIARQKKDYKHEVERNTQALNQVDFSQF